MSNTGFFTNIDLENPYERNNMHKHRHNIITVIRRAIIEAVVE